MICFGGGLLFGAGTDVFDVGPHLPSCRCSYGFSRVVFWFHVAVFGSFVFLPKLGQNVIWNPHGITNSGGVFSECLQATRKGQFNPLENVSFHHVAQQTHLKVIRALRRVP